MNDYLSRLRHAVLLNIVFCTGIFYFSQAQVPYSKIKKIGDSLEERVVKIDSVFRKYYEESFKIILEEIGEFQVSRRSFKYHRNLFSNRFRIEYQQPLSLNRADYLFRINFRLTHSLYIRGDQRRRQGRGNSTIFLLYKKDYEKLF